MVYQESKSFPSKSQRQYSALVEAERSTSSEVTGDKFGYNYPMETFFIQMPAFKNVH